MLILHRLHQYRDLSYVYATYANKIQRFALKISGFFELSSTSSRQKIFRMEKMGYGKLWHCRKWFQKNYNDTMTSLWDKGLRNKETHRDVTNSGLEMKNAARSPISHESFQEAAIRSIRFEIKGFGIKRRIGMSQIQDWRWKTPRDLQFPMNRFKRLRFAGDSLVHKHKR